MSENETPEIGEQKVAQKPPIGTTEPDGKSEFQYVNENGESKTQKIGVGDVLREDIEGTVNHNLILETIDEQFIIWVFEKEAYNTISFSEVRLSLTHEEESRYKITAYEDPYNLRSEE